MSESKHTPGPWSLRDGRILGAHRRIPQYAQTVASIVTTNNDTENADANARLIAAAPELLDAVKDAKAAIVHLNGEVACEKTLCAIRAAPAKATGGAS